MNLNIFDNDIACLILSNVKESKFETAKSGDNKVFFSFSLDEEYYKEAITLIERYETETIEINLKKYNNNRKMLLKKISEFKKAQ